MFSTLSVLIVDDDEFARGILRHHLTRLGFKFISEAIDGEQALDTLRVTKMDLVIADRYMPRINGIELFCSIKKEIGIVEAPFIMITVEDSEDKIQDALKIGIRHYLVKPFNAQIFDNKVQEALLQSELEFK